MLAYNYNCFTTHSRLLLFKSYPGGYLSRDCLYKVAENAIVLYMGSVKLLKYNKGGSTVIGVPCIYIIASLFCYK